MKKSTVVFLAVTAIIVFTSMMNYEFILFMWSALLDAYQLWFPEPTVQTAGFGGLLMIGLILTLYFMPALIAKGKPHGTQVFILNLLLGWTALGWIIALIWAFKPSKS